MIVAAPGTVNSHSIVIVWAVEIVKRRLKELSNDLMVGSLLSWGQIRRDKTLRLLAADVVCLGVHLYAGLRPEHVSLCRLCSLSSFVAYYPVIVLNNSHKWDVNLMLLLAAINWQEGQVWGRSGRFSAPFTFAPQKMVWPDVIARINAKVKGLGSSNWKCAVIPLTIIRF